MDDLALLQEYASRRSEAAFETLVSRWVNLVYSAALRQVRDPHLAEEITQAVFVLLAQKAGRMGKVTILSGWLFKTTRFVALAELRAATKRQQREQEAGMEAFTPSTSDSVWEEIAPLLDEGLAQLGEKDRQAVLLRFFENTTLNAQVKDQLTGLKIVSLGKPFTTAAYPGVFVPYEIRFKTGQVKQFRLAVRQDNPERRWYWDGGL